MGKLIVIEGVDASGKQTQTELLASRLPGARKIEFPNYQSESSALVKLYLNGAFGSKPEDVSPEAASVFFACDRYASYKMDWGAFYRQGGVVLADRYVTSNMIHQTCKLTDPARREAFLQWLDEFEYGLMGLPRPDLVIFLDMPPEYGRQLMAHRANKSNGSDQKDIHERDEAYLRRAYENAVAVAKRMGWYRLPCAQNGKITSPEKICEEIWRQVQTVITEC